MLLSTSVLLLASSAALASQAPARRDEWQPTPICMYMTNEVNWQGQAANLCAVPTYCGNTLPEGLTGNVTSAGPPKGVTCFLYSEEHCTGDISDPIVWPGYSDLSNPLIDFSKKARSWKCWKWCGYIDDVSSSSVGSTSSTAAASSQITATLSLSDLSSATSGSVTRQITTTIAA
ncbi:Hypothetical protein R9X50_00337000 [Acrodontium crateriforme]|uniref:Uncharacterized protein n=1 Tax=Acrodontium crateriforme TaxID=150365 RepID=A0AAQ3R9D3_9PEZI|nr:Hypothetical protein R9X50_00337000 [Acrodontium crateriforme]